MTKGRLWPLAVLVFGACVIGFAPILARLTETGPAAAGFWRFAFAVPLLALLAQRSDGFAIKGPVWAPFLAGLMFTLDVGFWHYSLRLTSVTNATVLSNLTPVVVTIATWLLFGQRPRAFFVLAMVVAIGGAALMSADRTGGGGANSLFGDALATTTAFWYALYFVAIAFARRTDGATRIMFWSSLTGAPLLLIAAWLLGEGIVPDSRSGWLACIGLGLVHVAGQGSIAWALGRLPTPTASVTVLVQPIVAAIVSWRLFGESLGGLQAFGGALALAGIVLAQRVGGAPPSGSKPQA